MGSDPYSTPKLPLFSMTPHLLEPSGMLTPPLQTSASIPFQWEEQPGKPRPCTDIILASTYPTTRPERYLELPPRLAVLESSIITKSPSPTTVLGGKSVFSSSSFRFSKERRRVGHRQGSFDSNCSGGWSPTDDSGGGGQQLLLSSSKNEHRNGGRGLFGSFRLKGNHKTKSNSIKEYEGSFVISPSATSTIDAGFFEEKKGKRMRRNSSLSKVTRSHFWAAIYEGFKHVVPWKKKPNKQSFII